MSEETQNALSKETGSAFRELKTVSYDLWPGLGFDPEATRRHRALVQVQCHLPEQPYQKLKRLYVDDQFEWFIPEEGLYGKVVSTPCAKFLYLSPLLERYAWDTLVGVAAHELAHLILEHELWGSIEDDDQAEEGVFRALCEWGFEAEAKKLEAICKRVVSNRATYQHKLLGELKKDTNKKRAGS